MLIDCAHRSAVVANNKESNSNNNILRGKFMGVGQIIKIVGVLVAVVAALWAEMPQAGLIIAVLGAVGGWFIEEDDASRFLIVVVALGMVNGGLGDITGVGGYITAILSSVSGLLNAAACTVIVVGIAKKLMP